jgi:hypothetical protein
MDQEAPEVTGFGRESHSVPVESLFEFLGVLRQAGFQLGVDGLRSSRRGRGKAVRFRRSSPRRLILIPESCGTCSCCRHPVFPQNPVLSVNSILRHGPLPKPGLGQSRPLPLTAGVSPRPLARPDGLTVP